MNVDQAFNFAGHFGCGQGKLFLPAIIGSGLLRPILMLLTQFTLYSSDSDPDAFESFYKEFNLNPGQKKSIESLFMMGIVIGNPVFGIISDRIGRQKTLLITTSFCVLCLILSGTRVVESFAGYSIVRFFSGFFDAGLTISQVSLILSGWKT